jgi:hypothetical protein
MQNYYQILNLQPEATTQEIAATIDQQYHQVRRLVNHHDHNVVNQANQALAILEEARTVLLDPTRRTAYDQSMFGSAGSVGGLADPTSPAPESGTSFGLGSLPVAAAAPPKSSAAPVPPPAVPAAAAPRLPVTWECSRCHSQSPVGSQFCKRCGETIGLVCPDCTRISEVSSVYCSNCGVKLDMAIRRKQINDQLSRSQISLANQQSANPKQDDKIKELRALTARSFGWLVLCILAAMYYLMMISGSIPPLEIIAGLWVGSLVLNWIIAAVCRAPAAALSSSGWANFFLLGVMGLEKYLEMAYIDYDTRIVFFGTVLFIMFLIALAAPRNFRSIATALKEHGSRLGILSTLSHLVSFILVAQPLTAAAAVAYYYLGLNPLGMDPGEALQFTLALAVFGYIACAVLVIIAGLSSMRATGKINHQVRVALDEQRKSIENLQGQIDVLNRELTMLH